jgi:hypothetical protein
MKSWSASGAGGFGERNLEASAGLLMKISIYQGVAIKPVR